VPSVRRGDGRWRQAAAREIDESALWPFVEMEIRDVVTQVAPP